MAHDLNETTLRTISAWELLEQMRRHAELLERAAAETTDIASARVDQRAADAIGSSRETVRQYCIGILADRAAAERSRVLRELRDTYGYGSHGALMFAISDNAPKLAR